MGMFDSLKVLTELPVEGEVAGLGVDWKNEVFQTKDLDNILGYYEIASDGRLRNLRDRAGWAEDDDGVEASIQDPAPEDWDYVDFHGRILFYTGHCDSPERKWDYSMDSSQMSWADIMQIEGYDWWIEFEATFDSGHLRGIKMVKSEKTTVRSRLANSKEWAERGERDGRRLSSKVRAQLKRVPGWRKSIRAVISFESAVHSSLSRLLYRLA